MFRSRLELSYLGLEMQLSTRAIGIKSQMFNECVIKNYLCPSGRKKSHCMLARRATCSQLRLGDAIGGNVHAARFNGQNSHTERHLTARG